MAKKDEAKDGSSTEEEASKVTEKAVAAVQSANDRIVVRGAIRRLLPRRRNSHTYKFRIADLSGFFTTGEYEDGTPGELFIQVSKQGSTLSGLMDSFSRSVSHGLQYGVPLKSYVETLMSSSFPPSGITDDPEIRTASSLMDYIFRRLALDYLSFDDRLELGLASIEEMPEAQQMLLGGDDQVSERHEENEEAVVEISQSTFSESVDTTDKVVPGDSAAPLCYNCGNQTQRAGSCFVCTSCGSTTGCS
jgi:ribonucleoside-diphosphate reductase alpha chain